MRRLLLPALLALALGCAHTSVPDVPMTILPAQTPAPSPEAMKEGEKVLAKPPKVDNIRMFSAPVPTVVTLTNGLRVFLVDRPEDPMEALLLVVRQGATADPAKLPGLASMSAAMLETGAAGRSQLQLAQAVDAIGASLSADASEDATVVSISALASEVRPMTGLVADVALRPNLSPDEWTKLKARRRAALLAERAEPTQVASRVWREAVYGHSPLGHPVDGTTASVDAMTLADVKGFLAGFAPSDAAVIAVGGADPDEVLDAVQSAFGDWSPDGEPAPAVAGLDQLPPHEPRLVVVDFPGKVQSVLRVGEPGVPRSDPDHLALQVFNEVLGGSFTSRLNQNLREKHGYTYGAFSAFAFGKGPGPFIAASSVKTAVTADALGQMLSELDRASHGDLTTDELRKGKSLLAFELVRTLESAESTAEEISSIFEYDLPLDELQTFVPRLNALSLEGVKLAAQRVLQPQKLTIAIAGDMRQVLPQLSKDAQLKLPAPQWRSVMGEVIPAPPGLARPALAPPAPPQGPDAPPANASDAPAPPNPEAEAPMAGPAPPGAPR